MIMPLISSALAHLALHAQWLALMVLAGACVGHRLGSLPTRLYHRIDQFGRRLNRQKRGAATLVYRGIIALALLLVPSLALGMVLARAPMPASAILLVAILGAGLNLHGLRSIWQRTARGTQPLELPGLDFLFADTHALLRYSILRSSVFFAIGVVGVSFWWLLGGMACAVSYLTLATCAYSFQGLAFGWAARTLFRVVDAIPRILSILLLLLASLFVPRTRRFAACRARHWHGFIAELLGISLGGALPTQTLPWAGNGTARIEAAHLLRWLAVLITATVLFVLTLTSKEIYNLLSLFI